MTGPATSPAPRRALKPSAGTISGTVVIGVRRRIIESRIAELEAVIERQYERIATLESLVVGIPAVPLVLGLSRMEAAVLSAIAAAEVATREQLMQAIYGRQMLPPDKKVIDAHVCNLRRKIAAHGLEIETVWGTGYRLQPASRDALIALTRRERIGKGGR